MMGRFINGDDRLVDNGNMFAYCGNNPIMNVDKKGTFSFNPVKLFNKIKSVISAVISYVNPASKFMNVRSGANRISYNERTIKTGDLGYPYK